jgi:hypothetical protein
MFTDDDIISTYTRANAIEDGVLIDVSELAREAGFRWPVAITNGVDEVLSDIPAGSLEDYTGRLWDVLTLAALAARSAGGRDWITFDVHITRPNRPHRLTRQVQTFKSHAGPGDDGEPVVTIMLDGED